MATSYITDDNSKRYDVKFYIQDSSSTPLWVDFSDISGAHGVDKLVSVGKINNKIEVGLGSIVSTIQHVVLDNSDGFFNLPFPSTLKDITEASTTWDLSSKYKRTVLRGHKCKVTVQIRIQNSAYTSSIAGEYGPMDVIEEQTLGVFYIEEVIPDFKRAEIKLKLISIDGRLSQKDCSGIKNGYGWYENRSVSFLIEEILKSELTEGGSLPTTYAISKTPEMPTLNSEDAVSDLGRPPLYDGSVWRNDGTYARALCWADVGNTGAKLYLGCDDELWSYDSTTGVYTAIDKTTIAAYGSDYKIKSIIYDDVYDVLYVCAWKDEYWGDTGPTSILNGWSFGSWIWNGSGSLSNRTTSIINSCKHVIRPTDDALSAGVYYLMVGSRTIVGTLYSENMFIPFPQDIQWSDQSVSSIYERIYYSSTEPSGYRKSIITANYESMRVANGQRFQYSSKGYTSYVFAASSLPTYYTTGIYHCGQPYLLFSGKSVGGNKRLYFFRHRSYTGSPDYNVFSHPNGSHWNYGLDWYELQVWNPVSQSANVISLDTSLGEHCVPLCGAQNGTQNRGYIFFESIPIPSTSSSSVNHETWVSQLITDVDTGTSSDYWGGSQQISTNDGQRIVACLSFGDNSGISSDKMIVVFFNRGGATASAVDGQSSGIYTLAVCYPGDLLTSTDLWGTDSIHLKNSYSPFYGLVWDSIDNVICFHNEGRLYSVAKSDNSITLFDEYPVVNNEYGLLSNMVVNDSHTAGKPEIFGVSSPTTHLESFYPYQTGKYNLFKLNQSITDIIPLANFDGMTKMEAISALVQSRDGIAFFDREGNFHYIQRVYSTGTADYTIGGFAGTTNIFKSVFLNYGHDKVFNLVKVKAYGSFVEPLKTEDFTLINRTTANIKGNDLSKVPFVDHFITQKDNSTKKIFIHCIRGGKTDSGESLWKYRIAEKQIEAILSVQGSAGTTTYSLGSVFGGDAEADGIHVGDFVSIVDSTGQKITQGITAVTISSNQITVANTLNSGFILKKGTVFIITRNKQKISATWNSAIWSDDGVTYLNGAVALNATTITVISVRDLSVGTVIQLGNTPYNYRINFMDNLVITLEDMAGGTTNVVQEAVPDSTKVRAFYSPKAIDGSEIGGTRVFIKWEAGSGIEERNYTKTFVPGDNLIIDCPGVQLKEETGGIQVVADGDSISREGKKELNIDNRFMHRTIAQEMSKRIIYYYADPRFYLKITVPLLPYIDMVTNNKLTLIDVINSELFPNSFDNTEQFHITSISHDVKAGSTTLELIGIDAY